MILQYFSPRKWGGWWAPREGWNQCFVNHYWSIVLHDTWTFHCNGRFSICSMTRHVPLRFKGNEDHQYEHFSWFQHSWNLRSTPPLIFSGAGWRLNYPQHTRADASCMASVQMSCCLTFVTFNLQRRLRTHIHSPPCKSTVANTAPSPSWSGGR